MGQAPSQPVCNVCGDGRGRIVEAVGANAGGNTAQQLAHSVLLDHRPALDEDSPWRAEDDTVSAGAAQYGGSSSSASVAGPPQPRWQPTGAELPMGMRPQDSDDTNGKVNMAMELATLLEDEVAAETEMRLPVLPFSLRSPRLALAGRHGFGGRNGLGNDDGGTSRPRSGASCPRRAGGERFAGAGGGVTSLRLGSVPPPPPVFCNSEDADETPPPSIRERVLVSEGEWEVHIHRFSERVQVPSSSSVLGPASDACPGTRRKGASASRTVQTRIPHGEGAVVLPPDDKSVMHDAIGATAALLEQASAPQGQARAASPTAGTLGYALFRGAGASDPFPPQPANTGMLEENSDLDNETPRAADSAAAAAVVAAAAAAAANVVQPPLLLRERSVVDGDERRWVAHSHVEHAFIALPSDKDGDTSSTGSGGPPVHHQAAARGHERLMHAGMTGRARQDARADTDKMDQDTEVPSCHTPRSQGSESLPSEGIVLSHHSTRTMPTGRGTLGQWSHGSLAGQRPQRQSVVRRGPGSYLGRQAARAIDDGTGRLMQV